MTFNDDEVLTIGHIRTAARIAVGFAVFWFWFTILTMHALGVTWANRKDIPWWVGLLFGIVGSALWAAYGAVKKRWPSVAAILAIVWVLGALTCDLLLGKG
jgi:hypothetical protein